MKARELAQNTGAHIVLKGAYTAVVSPTGRCWFNTTGNPGMATGGSGDVLTGVLLALLAQGYDGPPGCLRPRSGGRHRRAQAGPHGHDGGRYRHLLALGMEAAGRKG